MEYERIDPARHAHIRVGQGLATTDLLPLGHVQISCAEIAAAACDFPLAFLKDDQTGQFKLTALLGLDGKRNLFVSANGWHATHLPARFARQPFAWSQTEDGGLALALDLDHPRTHDPEGLPLFDASGQESAFLQERRQAMAAMLGDAKGTQAFVAALVENALIRPFLIDLTYADQRQERIDGLYTISAAGLAALSDDAALSLYRRGYSAFAYGILQSTGQFNRLHQLHNAWAAQDPAQTPLASVVVGLPD